MSFTMRPRPSSRATARAIAIVGTVVLGAWAALSGSPWLAAAFLGWHLGAYLLHPCDRRLAEHSQAPSSLPEPPANTTASERTADPADRSGSMAAWSHTSAGVLVLAKDGKVVWSNSAAELMLGRPLHGADVAEFLPTLPTDADPSVPTREHVAVTANGTFRPVAVHVDCQPATDERLVLVFDVSALQASERGLLLQNNLLQSASTALFDAKVSAEEASRRKTQFLAYASHEIRTPLQAILGFAEQLDENTLPDIERDEAIRIIRRNGEHLLTVLSDVLDLARIESDHLELRFAACDLRHEIDRVVELFAVMAKERGIAIVVEERTALPARVGTDKTRLRQVLINLLGNAVRCTRTVRAQPAARVVIGLEVQASPALVRVRIEDQGPGLPETELRRMFEPFDQAVAVADQRLGTGLGLAISRRLAKLLGGDLVAHSALGAGTTVEFTFDPGPLEPETHWRRRQTPVAARPVSTEGDLQVHVLLAEDGRDNRLLIGTILKRAGADVATVDDGVGAIAAVAAAERAGRPFDAIVMDMQMPVMDGYEATARLRADGCMLPILALTADALPDARQRCLDAGCDDYASKPIDRRGLISTLRRLLQVGHGGAAVDAEPSVADSTR